MSRPTRVAMLTPLPPARTGIANYASMILPSLARRLDIVAFSNPTGDSSGTTAQGYERRLLESYRRDEFDLAIHQLGNNPYHEPMYREAMSHPGIIVLHDFVLHHLIVEMTIARGDVEGYVAALRESHGEAGAAWARGRASGLHHEMANFLMPASIAVAQRSRAVIVHNSWAADRLHSFGVTTPIHVIPHPFEEVSPGVDRTAIRARLGLAPDDRVIGLFGFLTAAKRAEVVLKAFAAARSRNGRLRLLVVGEPAPNIDVSTMASDGVSFTGYAPDKEFAAYYAAVDLLVNLRYPSAGETSGTLVRALAAGKPVAVSDYAQFAELPDDCVTKIPFGPDEVTQLSNFFLSEHDDAGLAARQKLWLERHASMDLVVNGYVAAVEEAARGSREAPSMPATASRQVLAATEPPLAIHATIALFPMLSVAAVDREKFTITLRNDGDAAVVSRIYGEPGYRLIVRSFDERGVLLDDRWLALPVDLAAGASVSIALPLRHSRSVELAHALESIPMLPPEAFARVAF